MSRSSRSTVLSVCGVLAGAVVAAPPVTEISISDDLRPMLRYRDADSFDILDEVEVDREVRGLETIGQVMYVTAMVNAAHSLMILNAQTGKTTLIGPTGIQGEPSTGATLTKNPVTGTLYFSTDRSLYKVAPETGGMTKLGDYKFPQYDFMYGFAISHDGTAYGTRFGLLDQKADLYRINLDDATLTRLGDLGYSNDYYTMFAFRADGKLFGGRTGGEIWEINVNAATDKFVVQGGVTWYHGWDFTPDEGGGGDCYADFTGDGLLDLFDFLGFVNAFNLFDPLSDCAEDGLYDLFDFLCYTNEFNGGC